MTPRTVSIVLPTQMRVMHERIEMVLRGLAVTLENAK
jgi:hypothetical protein